MTNPELLAASVLKRIKDYYPKAPRPDADRTRAWARVFSRQASRYPAEVYEEAIDVWAAHSSETPTAHDVLESCKKVVALWEADRSKRQILDAHRQARLSARISRGELPPGTTPVRPPDEQTGGKTDAMEAFTQLRKELRRRRALQKHDQLATRRAEQAVQNLDELAEKYTKKEDQ